MLVLAPLLLAGFHPAGLTPPTGAPRPPVAQAPDLAARLREEWRWRRLDPGRVLAAALRVAPAAGGDGVVALTAGGIQRYDGYSWTLLRQELPCPATAVHTFLEGREGILVLSGDGAYLLDRTGAFQNLLSAGPSVQAVPRAACTPDGTLLVALGQVIYEVLDGRLIERAAVPDGTPVYALAVGDDGLWWCATRDACYRVRGGVWERLAPAVLPSGMRLARTLPLGKAQALFLPARTASGQELLLVAGDSRRVLTYAKQTTGIPAAVAVAPGTALLATVHEGLLLVEGDRIQPLPGLPVGEALLASGTRLGRHLVVVTAAGEVHACDLASRRWEVFPPPEPGPGLGTVNALARSGDGGLWVGTAAGLLRLPPGASSLERVPGPSMEGITDLYEDDRGRLWVAGGTGFRGAWELRDGKWYHHTEAEGIGDHYVHAIRPAPGGRLWFLLLGTEPSGKSSGGGVAVLAENGWTRLAAPADRRTPRAYDAVFPADGSAPLVATDRGIVRQAGNSWQPFQPRGPGHVFALHLAADGTLWAGGGFRGFGLWRFQKGHWSEVGRGVTWAANATGFAEEGGRLWLPSPHGLFLWREHRLLPAGREPGAPAHSFWPALARPDGCWLGSLGRGLVRFEADDVRPPRVVQAIALADPDRGGVDIQWQVRDWWEETPADHLAVEVRLDGGPWIGFQGMQTVFLPVAASGGHQVEVRAVDRLGNVSAAPVAISFHLPRPFLARPEGMAVLGALTLAVLALGYTGWRRRTDRERERRREQQLLAESERHFRNLVESADLVLTHYGPDGAMLYASPQIEVLTGHSPEAFLADPGLGDRLILPEDRPANEALRDLRRAGRNETRTVQFRIRDRRGRIRHVLERQSPRVGADGRLLGYDAVAVDITEVEDLRSALARSVERFRRIVEHLQEGIWILDEEGATVYANRKMAEILRLPDSEDLARRRLEDFLPAGDETVLRARRRAAGGEDARCEARLQAADGSTRWVLLGIGPLPPEAGSGLVVTCADVTEERRAREALLQTQKLESLGVLAGGIAHDFNNLLVAVLGNAGLLREDLAGHPEQAELLAEIEEAANRAAELCRQMLAYAGRANAEQGILDLSEIVSGLRRLLDVTVPKHVELVLDLAPEPVLVDGDATQLRQVVMNLVGNAAEAIGEAPGRIRVATSIRVLDRAALDGLYGGQNLAPGCFALLDVEDDGCGMDAATRERIFEPFFSTRFPGRGLGLASVLGIVRAHGGALGVRSAPGEGTLFCVVLPAAAAAQPGAGGGPAGGDAARGGR